MENLTREKIIFRHFLILPLLGKSTSLLLWNLPLDMYFFPEHKMHAI
jgi:hypothetical protein